MAITSAQAVNLLVDMLKTSPFFTGTGKVTGFVYPLKRPLNSKAEDIVVNTLTLDRGPVQQGMLNVNVYVNNEELENGTETDDTRPDQERLTYLSGIGNEFLKEWWSADGRVSFELQGDITQEDPKAKQHYVNFRVIFRALNV